MYCIRNFLLTSLVIVLLTAILSFKNYSPVGQGNLKVVVNGIRNSNGQIGFCLFKTADGFPNHPEKATSTTYVKASGNSAVYTFTNIDLGVYAVSVFHDENSDKTVNSNFLGIPTEGIGVSNNVKGSFGPPKFEDATFNFAQSGQTITITINYL